MSFSQVAAECIVCANCGNEPTEADRTSLYVVRTGFPLCLKCQALAGLASASLCVDCGADITNDREAIQHNATFGSCLCFACQIRAGEKLIADRVPGYGATNPGEFSRLADLAGIATCERSRRESAAQHKAMMHGSEIRAAAIAEGLAVDTGTLRSYKGTGILCADGKRRSVRITGESGSIGSLPASVSVAGRTVTGHIYSAGYEDTAADLHFSANDYGCNHDALPEWAEWRAAGMPDNALDIARRAQQVASDRAAMAGSI